MVITLSGTLPDRGRKRCCWVFGKPASALSLLLAGYQAGLRKRVMTALPCTRVIVVGVDALACSEFLPKHRRTSRSASIWATLPV